jgi:Bacterial Ig-like domain (group 3)/Putative Ig domain
VPASWRLAVSPTVACLTAGLVCAAMLGALPAAAQKTPTSPAAPSIQSGVGTLGIGRFGYQKIKASGYPPPMFTESGDLPSGVSFAPMNGFALLRGTPAPGTGADYNITITATNNQGSDTEPYDLTVLQGPVFPSGFCPAPVTVGQYAHDDEGVTAWPPFFGLSENNGLPNGLSFTQNNDNEDLGWTSGTPQPGSGGVYGLQYSADVDDTNDFTRNLHCRMVVNEAPTFTDAGLATAVAGSPLPQPIVIGGNDGFPHTVSVKTSGSVPGVVAHTVAVKKQFSVTFSGTPKTPGDYPITVTADNGMSVTEDFVVVVTPAATVLQTTSLSLSAEPDPVPYDSSAQTYTATVNGGSAPTGYVQFSIGTTNTSVPLVNGQASFTTPATLDAQDYTVSATYSGDTVNASSAATEDLTVSPAPTTLTLTGPTTTPFGTSITYSASVACVPGCGTTPSGSVEFSDVADGTVTDVDLVNGQATFVTDSTLAAGGPYELDATFSSYSDAPTDFAASNTGSVFYDVGPVDIGLVEGDGDQADGLSALNDGDTLTVDPTANLELSADLTSVIAGIGTPPGPLSIDATMGTQDVTAQLGLNGTLDSPANDPGTGQSDYYWTIPPGDLTSLAASGSVTLTISSPGSADFGPASVSITLDWPLG